jgi:hypothetical protein
MSFCRTCTTIIVGVTELAVSNVRRPIYLIISTVCTSFAARNLVAWYSDSQDPFWQYASYLDLKKSVRSSCWGLFRKSFFCFPYRIGCIALLVCANRWQCYYLCHNVLASWSSECLWMQCPPLWVSWFKGNGTGTELLKWLATLCSNLHPASECNLWIVFVTSSVTK